MSDKELIIESNKVELEADSDLLNSDRYDKSRESVIEHLLFEIYDKWSYKCRHDSSWDSDTFTSASDVIGGFVWPKSIVTSHPGSDAEQKQSSLLSEYSLSQKSFSDLIKMRDDIQQMISLYSSRLVRQLRRKDHALIKRQKNCDILTAILQASSLKRREDTKLKFVMEPKPGNEAFRQWVDAMKGVARLPLGLPVEIRKKVWLSLANNHITVQKYDWNRVIKFAFNEKSNPDDDSLGLQIVKDLHRTGCDKFTTESERAILKRVLLAYARWNKRVGYCQGFNVLAAIILEVMERNEEDSLKIMVYLVDHILPESYFAQNLQALSIDMAVFRELLSIHVPKLAAHLNRLQTNSKNPVCPNNSLYEPPLTNVFTMQWFLTLFATCLPPDLVLRIWDSIILEGSEIILRTGIVIWEFLSDRLLKVNNADIFYCTMRDLTSQLLDGKIVQSEQLINRIYSMAPVPFPGLSSLRDRFTYNINPFSSIPTVVVSYGITDNDTGEEDVDDDDFNDLKDKSVNNYSLGCFSGMRSSGQLSHSKFKDNQIPLSLSSVDISQVGPGAVSSGPLVHQLTSPGATQERMTTNLTALESQYNKIKDKQKKATLLMTNIGAENASSKSHIVTPRKKGGNMNNEQGDNGQSASIVVNTTFPSPQNLIVNHLFLTRSSTSMAQNRPLFIRQSRLKSTSSDAASSKDFSAEFIKVNKNFFDFDHSKIRNSYTIPESTISSVRPSSDCSSTVNRIKRSHSQSDMVTSCDECSTPRLRSASMSYLGGTAKTLLELTKSAHRDNNITKYIENCDDVKPSFEPLPSLDLNSVLERHHERIKSGLILPKYLEIKKEVKKESLCDDIDSPTENGHTARWVAEQYLQNVSHASAESSHIPRQASITSSSNKSTYNPLFGTKAGFYKIMAQNRLSKSRVNGILHSAYSNEFQRSGVIQVVNCD